MTHSDHPTLEDLLLWQSGELTPEQVDPIARHAASCAQCQVNLAETQELFGDLASARAEAAQSKLKRILDEEQRDSWLSRLINPVRRGWAPASAAVLIVALVLYTFSDLTPQARADALLERATRQESAFAARPHIVSFEVQGFQCFAETGNAEGHLLPASASNACQSLSERLESAGWTYSDVLLAKGFQSWRSKLKKKRDSILKATNQTEITTSTEASPIRSATLRLRNSDLQPVSESLEFAPTDDEPASTIEVAEASQPEIAALSSAASPAIADVPNGTVAMHPRPAISAVDMAESHALLALHDAGADQNALIGIQREANGVKVWGVASSDTQKIAIAAALKSAPGVTEIVETEDEAAQSRQRLPWRPYHGDGPPLAQQQLQSLFPNDPQGLQEFVNSLDKASLELAAEARNRDALVSLAKRLSTTPEAGPLRQAADDLERQMIAQRASLAHRLAPLVGSVQLGDHSLSYPKALELYTLVHQVAYMSDSRSPVVFDAALRRIRLLLSAR